RQLRPRRGCRFFVSACADTRETTMMEQEEALAALRTRALLELESIDRSDGLDEWRTRYLGRERGELTAVLKGLGKLPAEQRKAIGQAANTVKVELERQLEERAKALRAAETAAALEREHIDVTLPGRRVPRGHMHPISATIREISRIFRLMGYQTLEGPE